MYISDFQKTESGKHIFTYMCSKNPTEASHDFERTRMNGTGLNTILSQHLIQAFAPNEVTAEEALQITNELCEKLLKGEYQYYLAVHTDKNHIHTLIARAESLNFRVCKSLPFADTLPENLMFCLSMISAIFKAVSLSSDTHFSTEYIGTQSCQ